MSDKEFLAYHYCSEEAFVNIIESKKLWLCDLTDSNDSEELIRTFNILWQSVKKRLVSTDLDRGVLDSTIEMIDRQFRIEIESFPPYGICFCEKEDLLSQWKEYGDLTQGLSIGFDINWFLNNGIKQQMPHPNKIQSNAIGCEKVIYHRDEFEEKMTDLCYKMIKKEGDNAWIKVLRPTFKCYSGFVKNPTFFEEREIRIVYYPLDNTGFSIKDVDVSDLKTNVKKHYELSWAKEGSQAIKSICIGNNCPMSEDDIIKLLSKNGVDKNDIKISVSETSYKIR